MSLSGWENDSSTLDVAKDCYTKGKILTDRSLSLSNGSSLLWIDVISANFKGSGKKPAFRESFIGLHRTCGNILSSLKILKGTSTPDDFLSSNVKITSSTSLGVTVRNEKGIIVITLDFHYTGVVLFLLTTLLIGSGSFNDSDESDHLIIPRMIL